MPPQLALAICTIFVLWLLRLDHKQAPNVSPALWIPTIWMLLIASKPLAVWFGTAGQDIESGSPLDRAFLLVLLCLGLIVLGARRFSLSSAIEQQKWVILILTYMLISIIWSDIPYISFKRWIRELVAVVMAFLVSSEKTPRDALQTIFRRTIYVLIPFSYILIHYFPVYGRMYAHWSGELMWTGVALHKNSFGRLCLLAAFFLIWTLITRGQGRSVAAVKYQNLLEAFLLTLTLWFLGGPQHNMSYSATANVAFAAGLAALIGLHWMKKRGILAFRRSWIVIMAVIIGYGTVTPMIGRLAIFDVSSSFGREETLTGRAEIWSRLVPLAMDEPLLGHGFGGFWTSSSVQAITVNEAHNGYLETILEIGFVGLFLVSMFVLSSCGRAQRLLAHDFDWGALWICFLLMTTVSNITESTIVGFSGCLASVLVVVSLVLSDKKERCGTVAS